jgi:O-antigen/teichoic acid export membrane protein
MILRKKLISNTFYLLLDWFSVSLLSFFYWLIAGKTLLPQEYGIVSTSVNLINLLSGIAIFGLGTAVWKLIPEYLAKRQKKKVSGLIKFSLKAILISNLLIATLLLIFYPFLTSVLKVPFTVIFIVAISLIILSFSNQLGSILYGFQNMRKVFTTHVAGHLTKIIVAAFLIFLGFSYFGPIIGFAVGFLLTALLRIGSIRLRTQAESIDKKFVMLEYALPAFIASLALIVFSNSQYIILTSITNPEVTGIFTVAMILTSLIAVIPGTLTTALFAIISQLSGAMNAKERQSHLIQLVLRYALFLSLPAAIFLVLFSKQVILIFSRPEYLVASQIFPILALAAIIYGCGNIFLSNLYAIGKTKINRNITIVMTLIFLASSIPLTYMFFSLDPSNKILPAFGLSLAYIFSVSILFFLSFFYLRKFITIILPLKTILKLVVASLVSLAFLYLVTRFTSGILSFCLAIIAGIIYLAILLPLKFYSKEDIEIIKYAAEKLPFKKRILGLAEFLSKYTQK